MEQENCTLDLENLDHQKEEKGTGIYNITKFTMLDYQGKMACIIWFTGCNMQCLYCHNPQIATAKGKYSLNEIKSFLKSRVGKLEAVVFSGGEATLFKKLPDLARYCHELGFKVKLDTNGTNPKVVKKLVEQGLIDYVALDYKANESNFSKVTNCKLWQKFQETLDYLMSVKNDFAFEVRTTWHTELLSKADIQEILDDLNSKGYDAPFYLQKCNMVDNSLAFAILPESEAIDISAITSGNIKVEIR